MVRTGAWRHYWDKLFYQSALGLSASSDSGIVATPFCEPDGNIATYPNFFTVLGGNMATDETNSVVITFYMDAAGLHPAGSGITFNQLTASTLSDSQFWPGDVYALPPYNKVAWTLAGTTKSMDFAIYMAFTRNEP